PKLSFFWSLPVAGFARWQEQAIDAWKRELGALWPEVLPHLAQVSDCSRLARASYRDATPRRWWRGRAVLVGDAAHAMSPLVGRGGDMALMDGLALCDALGAAHDATQALQDYGRLRRGHVAIYQFWSRWLTPVFQSERDALAAARDMLMLPLGRLPGGRGA